MTSGDDESLRLPFGIGGRGRDVEYLLGSDVLPEARRPQDVLSTSGESEGEHRRCERS